MATREEVEVGKQATAPIAWLHTLHMELDQKERRLSFLPDDASVFGTQGKDYDPTYKVTSEPLYTATAIRAAHAHMQGVRNTFIAFGGGKLLIDTGTYEGKPAVFVAPAKIGGEVGTSAKAEQGDLHSLEPGEFVLTFPTDEQARSVASALCNDAHMQSASLGYVVRWKGDDAYVGLRKTGRVFGPHLDKWHWQLRLDSDVLPQKEGQAPTKAAAQRACEAAIHDYMRGYGLLPAGTYDDGLEVANPFPKIVSAGLKGARFTGYRKLHGHPHPDEPPEQPSTGKKEYRAKRNQDQEVGR